MGEVLDFTGVTTLPISPETVIKGAQEADLKEVLILGYTKDDGLFMASSSPFKSDIMWLIESAKHLLLSKY